MKKWTLIGIFTIVSTSLAFADNGPFSNVDFNIKLGQNFFNSYNYSSGNYYLKTRTAQGVMFQAEAVRNFSEGNGLGVGIGYFSVPFQDNNLPGGILYENSNFDIIPIYVTYKQDFEKWGDVTPYVSYRLGYPATINHSTIISYYTGLYGGMSLGLKYDMFLVEMQYNIAKVIFKNNSNTQVVSPPDYVMNGVSLVGGISF